MNTKTANEKLSKEEKRVKDLIPILYKHQDDQGDDSWMMTGKRLLEYYNCRHYQEARKTDAFTYNSIFSNVQTLLPNLILHEPYIRSKPKNPYFLRKKASGETEAMNNLEQSVVMEAAVNHEYRIVKAIEEVIKSTFDALFWGFGVTKTGYGYKTVSDEDENYVVKDHVFLRRVNPRDIGFHPLATGVADSPALSHRIVTTKEKLKRNENYRNVDILVPQVPKHLEEKVKNISDAVKDYVTIWEIHDQENDKIYTFGGDNQILLWKRKREYNHNGSDFQLLRFTNEPDEFLAPPYMLTVEDEQRGMNELLTLMINHFHQFSGRVWVEEGIIDPDDIEKIRRGGQGAIQSIKSIDKVKFQAPLSMGGEYFSMLNVLQGLSDRTLGIPDFMRAASATRKSASESSFIKSDVDIKRQYLSMAVKKFILDGIDNMAYLMQEFFTEERYAYAYGSVDFKFVKYTREDIQGEYQFDFDVDSLTASNQTQVQELINALNVIAAHPVLMPILQTMDPMKLGKAIFKKMNLNIESFQTKELEDVVFIDPQKENKIALTPQEADIEQFGGIVPDPKPSEDYDKHMTAHNHAKAVAARLGLDTRELDRHMQLHERIRAASTQSQNPAFPPPMAPGMGQPNGPGPQPTPGGPVNLPGQAMANRIRPQ